jgi:hypothetical protein
VLVQDFLVVMRTVLAAAIGMVNAFFRWCPEGDGYVQRPDRQVPLHSIAHGPADHAPRMQIQDHSKIKPAFTRPNISDVTDPFLVRLIRREVTIQQVWRNVELVITVPLSADCFAIACQAMVVTLCLRVLTTDMPF